MGRTHRQSSVKTRRRRLYTGRCRDALDFHGKRVNHPSPTDATNQHDLRTHTHVWSTHADTFTEARLHMYLSEEWLKRWRTDTSQRLGVPPYFVCTNKQLEQLLADPPESCEELLARKGWGVKKINLYYEEFAKFMGWNVEFPIEYGPPKRRRTAPKTPAQPVASEPAIEYSDLTEEQAAIAKRIIESTGNVFLTGAAGTGKSYLFRYLKRAMPGRVAVTASTGIAAVAIGGQDDSLLGGRRTRARPAQRAHGAHGSARETPLADDGRCSSSTKSPCSTRGLYDKLAYIGACLRNVNQPFGDLRIVLCGDFFQLPPVDGPYAFQSRAWNAETLTLRVVMRCVDDALVDTLGKIREGRFEDGWLTDCHVDRKPTPTDGIPPTRLYCTNRDVDSENAARLAELPGDSRVFASNDTPKEAENPEDARVRRKVWKAARAKFRVPKSVTLKVGAQVTLTRNIPPWGVNGSRGVVVELDPPRVRFDSGYIWDCEYAVETRDEGTRAYLPLKLAWALTVHKSQGMSLTRVNVNVAKRVRLRPGLRRAVAGEDERGTVAQRTAAARKSGARARKG